MPLAYKTLFFDLDDTLWAFTENARDTLAQLYDRYGYGRWFRSFDHFYGLYRRRNLELWDVYAKGDITKEELNRERFSYPLRQVEAPLEPAAAFATDFLAEVGTKTKLVPHAREVLDCLRGRGYRLCILSNGFEELQCRKMRAAGIDGYFSHVVLSDHIGVLKPNKAIFHFALSVTQTQPGEALMIGDSWASDVEGAAVVGIDQVFFDPTGQAPVPFRPTYRIADLRELPETLLNEE